MKNYIPLFLIALLIWSCKRGPAIDMTEEEIDAYVQTCVSPDRVYDIGLGLRYSRDDESYQVTEYTYNDSLILHNIEEISMEHSRRRNIFYKNNLPVYLEDYLFEYGDSLKITERKVYLTGDGLLAAYERSGESELAVEGFKFHKVDMKFKDFDFQRPKDAMLQKGEFEMKFGEFLIINPESYLILENDKSEFGVALFILEGDLLLDELYEHPKEYKGKTIFVQHEFMNMNGIERMIYRGGIVKE
ncbi:MAG: hypothetical protein HUJ25_05000 [Crocinitomicaceae bacterium]|nr:hypothetical protein [Crocinitomicaceae bacterium]